MALTGGPEFRTDDPRLFRRAVDLLQSHAPNLLTQNFSVAVAVLMHRNFSASRRAGPPVRVHTPDSGPAISTLDLQTLCDGVYEKEVTFLPRGAEGPIYKPFTDSFKSRSPRTNNWRNSFDLQNGIGCDAPYDDEFLRNDAYLADQRVYCPFRDARTGECGSPSGRAGESRTCFNPNKKGLPPGPESRAKQPPKVLTRGDAGYWYVEPTPAVLTDLVWDPTNRVPAFPFAVALYGGSAYFAAWGSRASVERLQRDLIVDDIGFAAMFDTDAANPLNASILSAASGATGTVITSVTRAPTPIGRRPRGTPFSRRDPREFRARAAAEPDPNVRLRLLEKASWAHAAALERLATALAHLRPVEMLGGYDLYAETREGGHLFEVKSWRPENFVSQVRHGVAQLYEYRWRYRESLAADVTLYLVFDRDPNQAGSWLWEFLVEDRGIIPIWIERGELRTFPGLRERLRVLAR